MDPRVTAPLSGSAPLEPTALPAGTVVGDYVVEGRIGGGGMGTVYRAVHPVIGRRVAIKVLNPSFSDRSESVARFVREARTIHKVKHPGVPDVLTFGMLPNGYCYYVMELLEGEDLRTLMTRSGRLPQQRSIEIIDAIASILDAAHAAGIVHRDLKPENVFLTRDPKSRGGFEVKLLDFGVAKLTAEHDGLISGANAMIGTPVYMPPEQCFGQAIDQRADVYALGAVAYEMLTGKPPMGEDEVERLLEHKMEKPPPQPSKVLPELAPFDAAITKAMARNASQRHASAPELSRELRAVVFDLERKQQARHRRKWIAIGVALLIALAIALAIGLRSPRPSAAPPPVRIAPPPAPRPIAIDPAPIREVPPSLPSRAKKKGKKGRLKKAEERAPEDSIVPEMPVDY